MTKYSLEVRYRVGTYSDGWFWELYQVSENGYVFVTKASELYSFRWTAILGGKRAARKHERNKKRSTPYTKEFTI